MNEDYSVVADGDLVYMIRWWEIEQFDQVRVEVYSDQAADDGLTVPYEYKVKY